MKNKLFLCLVLSSVCSGVLAESISEMRTQILDTDMKFDQKKGLTQAQYDKNLENVNSALKGESRAELNMTLNNSKDSLESFESSASVRKVDELGGSRGAHVPSQFPREMGPGPVVPPDKHSEEHGFLDHTAERIWDHDGASQESNAANQAFKKGGIMNDIDGVGDSIAAGMNRLTGGTMAGMAEGAHLLGGGLLHDTEKLSKEATHQKNLADQDFKKGGFDNDMAGVGHEAARVASDAGEVVAGAATAVAGAAGVVGGAIAGAVAGAADDVGHGVEDVGDDIGHFFSHDLF